jgi:hypothetical protein
MADEQADDGKPLLTQEETRTVTVSILEEKVHRTRREGTPPVPAGCISKIQAVRSQLWLTIV